MLCVLNQDLKSVTVVVLLFLNTKLEAVIDISPLLKILGEPIFASLKYVAINLPQFIAPVGLAI